mgnify:CR=1 FL=1
MTTHATLIEARQAAKDYNAGRNCDRISHIIEIEHTDAAPARCYIKAKCGIEALRKALKSMSEIKALIAEHDIRTDAEVAVDVAQASYLAGLRCERCGEHVDGTSCYKQQEWARFGGKAVRVTACYCEGCARLLRAIGSGERTAMEERGATVPAQERSHPMDA